MNSTDGRIASGTAAPDTERRRSPLTLSRAGEYRQGDLPSPSHSQWDKVAEPGNLFRPVKLRRGRSSRQAHEQHIAPDVVNSIGKFSGPSVYPPTTGDARARRVSRHRVQNPCNTNR